MPPTGPSFGNKDGAANASFLNKKDENRRTLTDFKIVGLSIPELDWTWGVVPQSASATANVKEEASETDSAPVVKDEPADDKSAVLPDVKEPSSETKADSSARAVKTEDVDPPATSDGKAPPEAADQPAASRYPADTNGTNPPPSRMRIYFHTPVTADDSRPIPHTVSPSYEANRKGKRKKLEDDDGDLEEGRAPPPPPQMSALNEDRASVAASATTDTVSEDWLMAAIVEGEDGTGVHEGDGDGPETQAVGDVHDDDLDAEGEVETLMDGERSFYVGCDDELCGGLDARPPCAHIPNSPFSSLHKGDHLDDDDIDMGGGASAHAEGQPASETHPEIPAPGPSVSTHSHNGLPTGVVPSDGQPAGADLAAPPVVPDVGEGGNPSALGPSSTHNDVDDLNTKPETLFDAPTSVDTASVFDRFPTELTTHTAYFLQYFFGGQFGAH